MFNFKDLIIFEMANNHQGNIDHGLRIIEEMANISNKYQIRSAIKFQYRDLDTIIHPNFLHNKEVKHIPRFLETRLSWKDFQILNMAVHERGLISVITVFDEKSIDMALNHGVDIIKVASCSCNDWPLLEQITKVKKPIIVSTGGCNIADIDNIVNFFEHRNVADLALLHCVGVYPTEDDDQQLYLLRRMIKRYTNYSVGYSGHEAPDNLNVAAAVVAIGAQILERHVGISTEQIKLNNYSMNVEQTKRWVEQIIKYRKMIGIEQYERKTKEIEEKSLNTLRRGVYAKMNIKKGDIISYDKIFYALPVQEKQTTTREYINTMKASHDYGVNMPIYEKRQYDSTYVMRQVVHEAKGFLKEAQISLGNDFDVELSHHYGLDNFRRFGAIIISIVNRDYCKKLITLLPGQYHPSHAHKIKEETFQVLFGEMEIEIENEKRIMRAGDIQLIKPNVYHAFGTSDGVVFEEVSTTHIKDDSYYLDNNISVKPINERKTRIEKW